MLIKLWGVRGSIPAPHQPDALDRKSSKLLNDFFESGRTQSSEIEDFLSSRPSYQTHGWGGNTTCVTASCGDTEIIIDGGTGIRDYGNSLLSGPCGRGEGVVHLFFTHVHWDHIMGLPFFVPLFIPGNEIHIYGVEEGLEDVFSTLFQKPFFPVPLEALGAKRFFHLLEPRQPHTQGDLTITPYQLDHPDPCWGYRIENGTSSYSHCVDTECTRATATAMGDDLPLYHKADLMAFDAQYTTKEKFERVNWGHASAVLGIDIAIREGVKKVIFMHSDPASSDETIESLLIQTDKYLKYLQQMAKEHGATPPELEWCFGEEGMVFRLP